MIFCLLLARHSPGVSTQVLRSTMSLSFTEWVEKSSETSCLSNVERSKRYYALVSQALHAFAMKLGEKCGLVVIEGAFKDSGDRFLSEVACMDG